MTKNTFTEKVIANIIQSIDIDWSIAEQDNNPEIHRIFQCDLINEDLFFEINSN